MALGVHAQCPAGKRIVGISSGRYNVLALDDTGALHMWGLDGCGSEGRVPAKDAAWMARQAGGGLQGQQVKAFDSGARMGACRVFQALPFFPSLHLSLIRMHAHTYALKHARYYEWLRVWAGKVWVTCARLYAVNCRYTLLSPTHTYVLWIAGSVLWIAALRCCLLHTPPCAVDCRIRAVDCRHGHRGSIHLQHPGRRLRRDLRAEALWQPCRGTGSRHRPLPTGQGKTHAPAWPA